MQPKPAHKDSLEVPMTDLNPQASQMTDESMVRTLAAQVRCIWPQEKCLFARYGTPKNILDVGCGTGEFTACLAETYPHASITGIELDAEHVSRAQARCSEFGPRVQINQGDAFDLKLPEASFDLVVCRHVLQAVPKPEDIVAQCSSVLKPGGWMHLLLEDYTMIHIEGPPEFDQFWLDGPVRFGLDTGCDMRIGRRGLSLVPELQEKRLDYIVVDTERVSRVDLAEVFIAWRDGYSEVLATYQNRTPNEVAKVLDAMIDSIRTRYALWQIPIVSGRLEN